jgi:general secretion pathway protein G
MNVLAGTPSSQGSRQKGTTLLELIVTVGILLVLSTAAVPVSHFLVVRPKEWELRRELREIRNAIDRYHEFAGRVFQSEVGSEGYPPDLQTLVDGVHSYGGSEQKFRFLRRIPVDPMTGKSDWQLRSVQDDPEASSWGGNDVFDVHSSSTATALDGTKYSDW